MAEIINFSDPVDTFDVSADVLAKAAERKWVRVMVIGIDAETGFGGLTGCTQLEVMISDLTRMKHHLLADIRETGSPTSSYPPAPDDDAS
jgi:hypothetical protein